MWIFRAVDCGVEVYAKLGKIDLDVLAEQSAALFSMKP